MGQKSKSLLGDELDLVCRKTYYFFVLLLKNNSKRTLEGSFRGEGESAQCGNFMIFLIFRFFVKPISGILDVQNLPF